KAKEAAERRHATMTGTDKNAVAEAMARIAAKKAAAAQSATEELSTQASSNHPSQVTTSATTDAPKGKAAAVAAAIARAKAKKAAQVNANGVDANGAEKDSTENLDASVESVLATDAITQQAPLSQKDNVAAAIARAKAKKAAQQPHIAPLESTATADSTAEARAADDKKAKVAAAVARAKAKKAAASIAEAKSGLEAESSLEAESTSVDEIQTKANLTSPSIAALDTVAAKPEAVLPSVEPTAEPIETAALSSDELKKARIAATIAKAKAKKAALAQETEASRDSSVAND
ncbi:MAG: electron transport complex subunit RsxC, partial [Shewanella sp.]